ncbi:60S ribosomal protein L6 [Candida maltosa Xu316]|uniref:60S ribosomal protein L6 n=1 Tax=Candida maltosa (strain Xu316) TaxID=1245528 RepID=M3HHE5_CANMX|nr:60S ribosomal protein L6 [Candida maltosa Xu316]
MSAVLKQTRKTQHQNKVRSSITPGTVVILLASRYRGKKAIVLKTLDNGVVVVNGIYKNNGVPIKQVNARYLLATSTKIDVSKVDVSKFTVEYFAREKSSKNKKSEAEFFNEAQPKKEIKAERIADQKTVDAALLSEVKKTPLLKQYLASSFSLKNGDRPHLMKF